MVMFCTEMNTCFCKVGRSFLSLIVMHHDKRAESGDTSNCSHAHIQDYMFRITTALEVSDARNQCCGGPKWCVGITCVVAKWAEVSQL